MDICLFDTHCDTAYEMYKRGLGLYSNELHISLSYTEKYKSYCQCMALWSDKTLNDNEAYLRFFDMYEYLSKETEKAGKATLCRKYSDIEKAHNEGKAAFILTVEDARLLAGDISRLNALFKCGVKMLTFQWQGETCIGGGFDTNKPLTSFGKELAHSCANLGIIPDVSHACERTARGILEIMAEYSLPVIATHSNSYSVYPHKRNLNDALFLDIILSGGIVGISLAPQHLTGKAAAKTDDVLLHIEHYAGKGGIGSICLGCDFDGIERTPDDIKDIRYLDTIAEAMLSHNYSESDVYAVFFENAKRFLEKNL